MKKRIAIFAHYDKDGLVDDYVIEYLKRLKEVVQDIIFVSDGDLKDNQKEKLKLLCLDIIASKHGEYDFGSYKRGFNFFKEFFKDKFLTADELILANDSCFAINSFDLIFKDMDLKNNLDAWGLTDNDEYSYHLQSYFLVLRKSIFLEDFFKNYINSIKKISDKHELVLQYEVGLSRILKEQNKSFFAYFGADEVKNYIAKNELEIKKEIVEIVAGYANYLDQEFLYKIVSTINWSYCRSDVFFVLVKMGCPLLKNRFSKKKIIPLFGCKILKKYINYDVELINNYRFRVGNRALMTKSELVVFFKMAIFLLKSFFKKRLNINYYK